MPVRMKKTKKYEKFYKCENSSSKNIDSEIEDFTIENPIVNACYFDRFLPAHFVGKFAWFWSEIRMFERTFHAFIKIFIFFSFFHSNRHEKLLLPMSRQSPLAQNLHTFEFSTNN